MPPLKSQEISCLAGSARGPNSAKEITPMAASPKCRPGAQSISPGRSHSSGFRREERGSGGALCIPRGLHSSLLTRPWAPLRPVNLWPVNPCSWGAEKAVLLGADPTQPYVLRVPSLCCPTVKPALLCLLCPAHGEKLPSLRGSPSQHASCLTSRELLNLSEPCLLHL